MKQMFIKERNGDIIEIGTAGKIIYTVAVILSGGAVGVISYLFWRKVLTIIARRKAINEK